MPRRNPQNRSLMSAEEFNDIIWNFSDDDELSTQEIIRNSKEVFLLSNRANIDRDEKNYYKDDYIKKLLNYALHQKNEWRNSGQMAEQTIQRALKLKPDLPVAYYRLGHIHFRNKSYAEAVTCFYKALEINSPKKKFTLDEMQIKNAKWVLSFCALEVFNQYQPDEKKNKMYPELAERIFEYQQRGGFTRVVEVFQNGEKVSVESGNYQKFQNQLNSDNRIVLIDTTDGRSTVNYYGEVRLGFLALSLLLRIVRKEENDLIRQMRRENINSFNQSISRLRRNLENVGLCSPEFEIINEREKPPRLSTGLTIHILRLLEA